MPMFSFHDDFQQTVFCYYSHQESHVQVADDVFLHTREYGDSKSGTAPVVLLVHGFPDLSLGWQYQAERLAKAGYFVVAPDMRAYGSSSMPKGVANYGRTTLVSDIHALRKHYCGGENGSFAMIAAHDWGGVIVWSTLDAYGLIEDSGENAATSRNTPIARCAVIFNAPHPQIFLNYVTSPKQAIKSWYMFYFQIPWLPEVMLYYTKALYYLLAYHLAPLKQVESVDMTKTFAVYWEALTADYDRIRAMLSYYRSIKSGLWREPGDKSPWTYLERLVQWYHGISVEEDPTSCQIEEQEDEEEESPESDNEDGFRITIPMLILWGTKDIALENQLAVPPASVKTWHIEFFDAGHCPQWDFPQETAQRMIDFTNAHNIHNNQNNNHGESAAANIMNAD
ncbi:MAG: hypothetical protein SGBAC_001869 [Bacillariaceae sp.]